MSDRILPSQMLKAMLNRDNHNTEEHVYAESVVDDLMIEDLDLSMSELLDSEDAEMLTSGISPSKKKKRGKKRKRLKTKMNLEEDHEQVDKTDLLDALFSGDDDFGDEETPEPSPKRQRRTLIIPAYSSEEEVEGNEPSSSAPVSPRIPTDGDDFAATQDPQRPGSQDRHQMKIEDVTPMIHDRHSVIRNTAENVATRCLFSSNRSTSRGEPFALKVSDDNDSLAFPSETLYGPWALMGREEVCVAASSKRGAKDALQRFPGLRGRQGCEVATSGDRSGYFVVVGGETAFAASPFFAYNMQVVQLNPERVQFALNPAIPVYLLLGVVEKRPLMDPSAPVDVWIKALHSILKDSLYVHMAQSHWDWVGLKRILCSEDHLPQAQDPGKSSVGTAALSLTNHSTRQQRSGFLTKNVTGILRSTAKALKGGEEALISKSSLLMSLQTFRSISDLIYCDLEKDSETLQMLASGMPLATLSGISSWKTRWIKNVRAQANYIRESLLSGSIAFEQLRLTDPTSARKGAGKGSTDRFPLRPMSAHRFVHLKPRWFATCFAWICETHNARRAVAGESKVTEGEVRKHRLETFRAFLFSDLVHTTMQRMKRFQANFVFLFTRRHREEYFASNAFSASHDERVIQLLNPDLPSMSEVPSARYGGEPLSEREEDDMIKKILFFLKKAPPKEFRITESDSNFATATKVAVATSYRRAAECLARMVETVTANWTRAWRDNTLSEALAVTPPLVVKITYIYGRKNDAFEQIQKVLIGEAGGGNFAVISPGDSSGKRRAAFKCARVIVLNELHRWSSHHVAEVSADFDVAKSSKGGSGVKCTHLVVLGYTGLLGNHAGEALLADLFSVSQRLEETVDKLARSTDSLAYRNALAVKLIPQGFYDSRGYGGSRSTAHLPEGWRESQLDANMASIVCEPSLVNLMRVLKSSIAKTRRDTAVYVFHRTMATQNRFKTAFGATHAFTKCHVRYVSYHTLSHVASDIYEERSRCRVDVVLLDVQEAPTVYHINSAFAAVTTRLWVLADDSTFRSAYMKNNSAADRESFHIEQFPLLRNVLEKRLLGPGSSFDNLMVSNAL